MRLFLNKNLTPLKLSSFIKYALGEILLIVLGILVAFQLSSWADDNKAKKIEIQTLKDINEALKLDKNDLEFNIYLYNKVITSCDTILALLDNKLTYEPKMNKYFSGPCLVAVFYSNVGPYETLKSRGLETISNDTLRNSIVRIYEFNYNGLKKFESQLTDYVQTIEKNFYPTNFDQSYPFDTKNWNLYGEMIPNDFENLKQSKEYMHYVKTIRNKTDFFLKSTYIGTHKRTSKLINHLESEIKRLD